MRLARFTACLMIAGSMIVLGPSPAQAECEGSTDMYDTEQTCYLDADQVRSAYSSGDTATWSTSLKCGQSIDGKCFNPRICVSASGDRGLLYDILRTPPGGPTEFYGVACLTFGETRSLGAITPALVFSAMQQLTWPTSEIIVQPPNGKTLVNLETNFYTANTTPTTRVVTLLGQRVEIEATPGRYVWHWAQPGESGAPADSGSFATTSPGAPYPDLDVVHVYRDAEITVHPSVDTVYSGRYRVNGGGWVTIPQTLTVPGESVSLEVVEARPQLVG